MRKRIEIMDYDSRWPLLFEKEKQRIEEVIGYTAIRIEHIGSTAVSGLGSKPIIDIMAAVKSIAEVRRCIEPLQQIGYAYRPELEIEIPERRYFHKGRPPQEQHYHLHIVEFSSNFWKKQLMFRDYLRMHPKTARDYFKLKKALAKEFGSDREGYTHAKSDFIESVIFEAGTEEGS